MRRRGGRHDTSTTHPRHVHDTSMQAAEGRLAAAREAHALLERGAGGEEEEEEDDANGTTNPRGTVSSRPHRP